MPPPTSSVTLLMKAASEPARKNACPRNFFGLAIAVERRADCLHRQEIAVRPIHVGVDGTWLDVVDRETARALIAGEKLEESTQEPTALL